MDEELKRSSRFGEGNPSPVDAADRELKNLLDSWQVSDVPPALDKRLIASYHQYMNDSAPIGATEQESDKSILARDKRRRSEVAKMKYCSTCNEGFADKFGFCPVDGTPLVPLAEAVTAATTITAAASAAGEPSLETGSSSFSMGAQVPPEVVSNSSVTGDAARDEYHLTMIEDIGLTRRLAAKLSDVAAESRLTWPEFKRDPAGYTKRAATGYGVATWKFFSQENVALASLAGIFVVSTVVLLVVVFSNLRERGITTANSEQLVQIMEFPVDQEPPPPEDRGMGANDQGRVGFNRGRGEGSRPEPRPARGGGGGGQNEPLPPQQGVPPAPGVIPDRIPTTPPPPTIQRLPPSGPDYDAALRPPASNLPFGVPVGGTERSAGPGTGEGLGTGRGTGVGSGDGRGVGPGNERNMGGGSPSDGGGGSGGGSGGNPNEPVPTRMLSRRVSILSKPEPLYTEEARRNQVSGTVVLRALFNSNGQVTNISPVQRLPHGLTEQAIAAARRITFSPAQRDGRAVSTYVTLQYSFNMY